MEFNEASSGPKQLYLARHILLFSPLYMKLVLEKMSVLTIFLRALQLETSALEEVSWK